MPLSLLPPVGEPISLSTRSAAVGERQHPLVYDGYRTRFYGSGTSALAQAMISAAQAFGGHKVILPAYACPDLISAAIFAGLTPILVDLEADSTHICLTRLAELLDEHVAAVVAVNFLGVPERLEAIAGLIAKPDCRCALIEDDAQWLPLPSGAHHRLRGDYVISSFGRGKPLSLLGGGVLWVKEALESPSALEFESASAITGLKIMAYNALRSPLLYALMDALPLGIGATRYHALVSLEAFDEARDKRLFANYQRYVAREEHARARLQTFFDDQQLASVIDLSASAERLLRYPILVAAGKRDGVIAALRNRGIGATAMYVKSLPDIEGVAEVVPGLSSSDYPNAHALATRLVTLPVHSDVKNRQLATMMDVLASI